MSKINVTVMFIFLSLVVFSCKKELTLPILGEQVLNPKTGKKSYYQTPPFELTNQNHQLISRDDLKGKVRVVDFFFTSCPTICPTMTRNLKMVEETFSEEPDIRILSHSIDPKRDTPERLKRYADAYDVNDRKWFFLTGSQEEIFELAKDYKVSAFDDGSDDENTSLIHDGTFILVDGKNRVRGYYNGIETSDTERLLEDIKTLLNE